MTVFQTMVSKIESLCQLPDRGGTVASVVKEISGGQAAAEICLRVHNVRST